MQVIKLKNGQVLVGLGNPGLKYRRNRHNLGQEVLKSLNLSKLGEIESQTVDSYMNESGRALAKILRNSPTTTKDILVVHDELDFPFGESHLQFGRSAAGNKGVQSIIDTLKSNEFWRLRIGIGPRPTDPSEEYVLQNLTASEKLKVDRLKPQVQETIVNWVENTGPVV